MLQAALQLQDHVLTRRHECLRNPELIRAYQTFDVWQPLDEGAQVVGRQKGAALLVLELRIEAVGTGFAGVARQVVQLALAGALHPAAGQVSSVTTAST